MEIADENPTTSFGLGPLNSRELPLPQQLERARLPRTGRVAATLTAAALVALAGVGVGMAVGSHGADSHPTARIVHTAHDHPPASPHGPGNDSDDPSRQEWIREYGQDRSTMANRPDVTAATPEQQAAASDLLSRTTAAMAPYSDVAKAQAAGYDMQASLAQAEQRNPGLTRRMKLLDAGTMPWRMPMLHVINRAYLHDGKVLNPAAPEALMYEYEGNGNWKLVGVMYIANEAYPQAPPVPGGPITRWHYHGDLGLPVLMMHLFFVPGNDLATAYALTMEGM